MINNGFVQLNIERYNELLEKERAIDNGDLFVIQGYYNQGYDIIYYSGKTKNKKELYDAIYEINKKEFLRLTSEISRLKDKLLLIIERMKNLKKSNFYKILKFLRIVKG
jgi:hypothetical protein